VAEAAYLCTGKDCRKRADDIDALHEVLDAAGVRVERVRCQKICRSPVLGLVVDGRLSWFAKLRGKSGRKALRRFLSEGTGPLRKLRVKKRAGKLR
jgi:hypothetical protein